MDTLTRETTIRTEILENRLMVNDEMRRAILENYHEAESKIRTLEEQVTYKNKTL